MCGVGGRWRRWYVETVEIAKHQSSHWDSIPVGGDSPPGASGLPLLLHSVTVFWFPPRAAPGLEGLDPATAVNCQLEELSRGAKEAFLFENPRVSSAVYASL